MHHAPGLWHMAARLGHDIDPRAVEHGQLVKERRLDLGLNRPAFVTEMARHGQEITPDYLNKLERGTAALSRASLEVREAIRAVLGYSAEQWQELTGLYIPARSGLPTPDLNALSAAGRGYRVPEPEPAPIPDSLIDAAHQYGHSPEFAGLQEPRWQHWLASVPHRRRPTTPAEWLDFYLRVKDTVDPPEVGN